MTFLEIIKNCLNPVKLTAKRVDFMKRNFWYLQPRDERGRFKK